MLGWLSCVWSRNIARKLAIASFIIRVRTCITQELTLDLRTHHVSVSFFFIYKWGTRYHHVLRQFDDHNITSSSLHSQQMQRLNLIFSRRYHDRTRVWSHHYRGLIVDFFHECIHKQPDIVFCVIWLPLACTVSPRNWVILPGNRISIRYAKLRTLLA